MITMTMLIMIKFKLHVYNLFVLMCKQKSRTEATNLSRNRSNIRPCKEFFISTIYGCNRTTQRCEIQWRQNDNYTDKI